MFVLLSFPCVICQQTNRSVGFPDSGSNSACDTQEEVSGKAERLQGPETTKDGRIGAEGHEWEAVGWGGLGPMDGKAN